MQLKDFNQFEKYEYSYLWIMAISWIVFIGWDWFIFQKNINEYTIRLDIYVVLPALLILSVYSCYQFLKK